MTVQSRLPELTKLGSAEARRAGYEDLMDTRPAMQPVDRRVIGAYALPRGSQFVTDLSVPYGTVIGFLVPDRDHHKTMVLVGCAYSDLTWRLWLDDQLAEACTEAVQIVRDGLADIDAWSTQVLAELTDDDEAGADA